MDRFAKNAELIDFLTNEKFGAHYTYRIEDGDTFEALLERAKTDADPQASELRIADGAGFLVVKRQLKQDESALTVGCSEAPGNTILVGIERLPFPTADGS